ncbi:hypothetical protein KGM_208790 [Danaus plexippus plexippus]|uniref:Uncharacterized protein n=1 Tax=Danaus plexippus plexippus TaxID=278856 RepID=A0A212EGU4_DANPL|nr:hypothetical protein KGM_208790 [Danaus plexippus plexippus]
MLLWGLCVLTLAGLATAQGPEKIVCEANVNLYIKVPKSLPKY